MTGCLVQGASRALIEQVAFTRARQTSLDWVSYPTIRFNDAPEGDDGRGAAARPAVVRLGRADDCGGSGRDRQRVLRRDGRAPHPHADDAVLRARRTGSGSVREERSSPRRERWPASPSAGLVVTKLLPSLDGRVCASFYRRRALRRRPGVRRDRQRRRPSDGRDARRGCYGRPKTDATVVAAEAHRIRERDVELHLALHVRDVVEVARRVGLVVVDRRRERLRRGARGCT